MKIKPTSEKAKSASKVSSRSHLGDTSCVPELRFPHFTTPWETTPLSRLLRFQNGVNAPAEKYGRGVKFVSVSDIIQNDYVTYDNIAGSVDIDDATLERYSVENGDMVFQRSSETVEDIGRANVYLDNRTATFGGFVIRGKKIGEYNPYFFKCLLYSNEARRKVIRAGAGAQHYNIGQEALSQIYLHFPEMAEQRRIADLLLLVSNRIDAQRKLVELLKKHKRGLHSAIFGQKCRVVNADGKPWPAWRQVRIGDIFQERSERGGTADELLSVTINNGVKRQADTDKKDSSSEDKSNYKKVLPGDIVYNTMRMWQGASGVSPWAGIVSPAYTVIYPRGRQNTTFWAYAFKYWRLIQEFQKFSQGLTSDTWNLKYPQLSDIRVYEPSMDEQEAIVDILSILDERVSAAEQELNKMRNLKSGLLQQLFV